MDEQKPRDVFFFEQDGAFVVRLLMGGQQGAKHMLAEFTRDDIAEMVARGPSLRQPDTAAPAAADPTHTARTPAARRAPTHTAREGAAATPPPAGWPPPRPAHP